MRTVDLLKYRSTLITIAMLWIVLAHSGLTLPGHLLPFIKATGYGGVDICLFASGAGCFFSLERDSDPLRFLKRRAIRLLPSYWLFMIFWLSFRCCLGEFSPINAIGNILGVQTLTGKGGDFNWYISMLFISYLVAPVLKAAADRCRSVSGHIAIVLLLCAVSVPFLNSDNLIIAARLPVFYTGMAAAKLIHEGRRVTRKTFTLLASAVFAGIALLLLFSTFLPDYLWRFGMHWYPFILITPGLCTAISAIMTRMNRFRLFNRFSDAVAGHSFELYLAHILVFEMAHRTLHANPSLNTPAVWIIAVAIAAAGTVVLSALSTLIRKRLPGFQPSA